MKKTEGSIGAYQLAIAGLPAEASHMRLGGLYYIEADGLEEMAELLGQLRRSDGSPQEGLIVISEERLPSFFEKQNSGILALRPSKNISDALDTLPKDLERRLKPRGRIIVVAISAQHLFLRQDLQELLYDWAVWSRRSSCTVLIAGTERVATASLSPLLTTMADVVQGVAKLTVQKNGHIYEVLYWSSAYGIDAKATYRLTADQGRYAVENRYAEDSPLLDAPVLYHSTAFAGQTGSLPPSWVGHETELALFEGARKQSDATVIFAVESYGGLPKLATRVHTLRRERGSRLRIIVKEVGLTVRNLDEQRLLACGATLLVSTDAPLTRLINLVDSIRATTFHRRLADDPEQLFTEAAAALPTGPVPLPQFAAHVNQLVDQGQEAISTGVLVKLVPSVGLSPENILRQLNIKRANDIVCLTSEHLYLFLHGCHPNLVSVALTNVFRLPFQEIFSAHTVFPDPRSIRTEVSRIVMEADTSDLSLTQGPDPNTDLWPSKSQLDSLDKSVPFYSPHLKALTLAERIE